MKCLTKESSLVFTGDFVWPANDITKIPVALGRRLPARREGLSQPALWVPGLFLDTFTFRGVPVEMGGVAVFPRKRPGKALRAGVLCMCRGCGECRPRLVVCGFTLACLPGEWSPSRLRSPLKPGQAGHPSEHPSRRPGICRRQERLLQGAG